MLFKCKHDWKVVSKEYIPSLSEKSKNLSDEVRGKEATKLWLTWKHITIISCTKCGKIYEVAVSNFDD